MKSETLYRRNDTFQMCPPLFPLAHYGRLTNGLYYMSVCFSSERVHFDFDCLFRFFFLVTTRKLGKHTFHFIASCKRRVVLLTRVRSDIIFGIESHHDLERTSAFQWKQVRECGRGLKRTIVERERQRTNLEDAAGEQHNNKKEEGN